MGISTSSPSPSADAVAIASNTNFAAIRERFAVSSSKERAQVLSKLVPGTVDYAFFKFLLLTNDGSDSNENEREQLLSQLSSHKYYNSLALRHKLLRLCHSFSPKETETFARNVLHLSFNHFQKPRGKKSQSQVSTTDAASPPRSESVVVKADIEVALEAHMKNALTQSYYLNNITSNHGAKEKLLLKCEDAEVRYTLLASLRHPSVPGLVDVIVKDLNVDWTKRGKRGSKDTGASRFGELSIHSLLTLDQLESLKRKVSDIDTNITYVQTYLSRLPPPPCHAWLESRGKEMKDYLDRLHRFTSSLSPTFNSLKAAVIYHRLMYQRDSVGVLDETDIKQYLKFPRYHHQRIKEKDTRPEHRVSFGQGVSPSGLRTVTASDDEVLIEWYLLQCFSKASCKGVTEFKDIFHKEYLDKMYAKAKLCYSVEDSDENTLKQYRETLASEIQSLINKVDIEFLPNTKEFYKPTDPIVLNVYIKNIRHLIVKVFEINTGSFYRQNPNEDITTAIKLDGLVANQEQVYDYDSHSLKKICHEFPFPNLPSRGVFVIEFIGNGISSRALIRRGNLNYISTVRSTGHVISVLNETNEIEKNIKIYYGGHDYTIDDVSGELIIPFSTNPGSFPLLISDDTGFTVRALFDHAAEQYTWEVGGHIEKEQLVSGAKAHVILRPRLYSNDRPISLNALLADKSEVTIDCISKDNVSSNKTIKVFLKDEEECVVSFKVPDDLRRVTVSLSASIRKSSGNGEIVSLCDTFTTTVNEINDQCDRLHDVLLRKDSNHQYYLVWVGKTGEPLAGRSLTVTFLHRDCNQGLSYTKTTDSGGRVYVDILSHITRLSVAFENQMKSWDMSMYCGSSVIKSGRSSYTTSSGMLLRIPYNGSREGPLSSLFALLERRDGCGGGYFRDVTDTWLSIHDDGYLIVTCRDEGSYELYLKSSQYDTPITIDVGKHERQWCEKGGDGDRYACCENKVYLEMNDAVPLQIASITPLSDTIKIQLAGYEGGAARVHVIGTHFFPATCATLALGKNKEYSSGSLLLGLPKSTFSVGRTLDEEMRYIMDRKYKKQRTGNMLNRPGCLLQPWEVSNTSTTTQAPKSGDDYDRSCGSANRSMMKRCMAQDRYELSGMQSVSESLEFLRYPASVSYNLRPDKEGVVVVPYSSFAGGSLGRGAVTVHVIAADEGGIVSRHITVGDDRLVETLECPVSSYGPRYRDLSLSAKSTLPSEIDYVEARAITEVYAGQQFEAVGASETFDSMPRVYDLYLTLSKERTTDYDALKKFSCFMNWELLSYAEKCQQLNNMCHELNMFIYYKDNFFFNDVVLPYLKNKKEPQFIDLYLMNEDLSSYESPGKFDALSAAEQLLLASRSRDSTLLARVTQKFQDLMELEGENDAKFSLVFNTALQSKAMEDSGMDDGVTEFVGESGGSTDAEEEGECCDKVKEEACPSVPGGGRWGGSGDGPCPPPSPPCAVASPVMMMAASAMPRSMGAMGYAMQSDDVSVAEQSLRPSPKKKMAGSVAKPSAPQRQLYVAADTTKELAESHYYHVRRGEERACRVSVSMFWAAYGQHLLSQRLDQQQGTSSTSPFITRFLGYPGLGSFTEMAFALAVLDLPFTAPEHPTALLGSGVVEVTAISPFVAYHRQVRVAEPHPAAADASILIKQTYFDPSDMFYWKGGEQVAKFLTPSTLSNPKSGAEFLPGTVYGCKLVVTNVSQSSQTLSVLSQVPRGALPVGGQAATASQVYRLSPLSTEEIIYKFYFPRVGVFEHWPSRASKREMVVARAAGAPCLNVVAELSQIDTKSWEDVSQMANNQDVLTFLKQEVSIYKIKLDKIAWRCGDKEFWSDVIKVLKSRCVYDSTLWSYAFIHANEEIIKEYFLKESLSHNLKPGFSCRLVTVDGIESKFYEHLEYAPLINARAYQLGSTKHILNDRLSNQYSNLIDLLIFKTDPSSQDLLASTYYLLVQDRVEEAATVFALITDTMLHSSDFSTKLQYAYFACYFAMSRGDMTTAKALALPYVSHSAPRWSKLFRDVIEHIAEAMGEGGLTIVDDDDVCDRSREKKILNAAHQEPSIDVRVDNGILKFDYCNLSSITLNYYLMDVELLFSTNPFFKSTDVGGLDLGKFAYIKPNATMTVAMDSSKSSMDVSLPPSIASSNVMIEVVAENIHKSFPMFAHSMIVQTMEAYGHIRVASRQSKQPLSSVYVKVYGRREDGSFMFYKDGHTDVRGRFDYVSLSTDDLDKTKEFSIFISSESHGCVIREAKAPKR